MAVNDSIVSTDTLQHLQFTVQDWKNKVRRKCDRYRKSKVSRQTEIMVRPSEMQKLSEEGGAKYYQELKKSIPIWTLFW